MEIFQVWISGETHLKRLKRLKIYGKFQSPVQKRAQRAHISREISRNRKLQMGQISQRISGNVCKCQGASWGLGIAGVSQLSRSCLAAVSQLSRNCFAGVSRVFRGCFAGVSRMFRVCFTLFRACHIW